MGAASPAGTDPSSRSSQSVPSITAASSELDLGEGAGVASPNRNSFAAGVASPNCNSFAAGASSPNCSPPVAGAASPNRGSTVAGSLS
jgi:hypothetical protein